MELLNVKDAASLLEVNARTVYRLINNGQLPAFKLGGQWRMRMNDLENWIDDQIRAREPSVSYEAGQTRLFGRTGEPGTKGKERGAAFSDSAFSENNGLPVHGWVPWIAGFSARFVDEAIARFAGSEMDAVLDPFAGVGTTLVTATLRGHDAVGFEINPYAAEVCSLKVNLIKVDVERLNDAIGEYVGWMKDALGRGVNPDSAPPEGFVTRSAFFSPPVLRKVLLTLDFVKRLSDPWVVKCFRVALGSELVGFSNYSYEPSLCRRETAGKRPVGDAPVASVVARKLYYMRDDIREMHGLVQRQGNWPVVRFRPADFFQGQEALDPESIGLVVTSPPYLNNYHYIRNSRPQMYWLGHVAESGELKSVEHGSYGKYWQTVRNSEPVSIDFSMPELEERLAALRCQNSEKGQYGGPGWANYAATYFNDSFRFASALARLLRPGGTGVVVLGNSILQGVEFQTDRIFGAICEANGLSVSDIEMLRTKRTGTSIINSSVRADEAPEKTELYESAVIVRKD